MRQRRSAGSIMRKAEGVLWAFPTALSIVWCVSAALVMIRALHR